VAAPGLDHESIIGPLQELNDELGRRGAKADLFLVGGAALALAYDAKRISLPHSRLHHRRRRPWPRPVSL
jgi:hypothetical protein